MGRTQSRGQLVQTAYLHPTASLLIADTAAWFGGLGAAALLRFDLDPNQVSWLALTVAATIASIASALAGVYTGAGSQRWRIASFEEIRRVALNTGIVTVLLFLGNLALTHRTMPLGAILAGGALALLAQLAIRGTWRFVVERSLRPDIRSRPLIVFGAGEASTQIVTALLRTPDAEYLPVALLDDYRSNRVVRGVAVVGGRGKIGECAERYAAQDLLIAIPSAPSELIREIADEATAAGLRIHILPSADHLSNDVVTTDDIRTLTEADLLERGELATNPEVVAAYLRDQVVLVTGAGGSIGSEICRQLTHHGPARIVMLDRDENGLHGTQLSMAGHGLLQNPDVIVGNIRDRERVTEIFEAVRPDVVFHAAALKHLPLLELHPEEGYKTNVIGTLNLLDAAAAVDVKRFVNVSTDKAADPTCVLGRTKRAAEQLTSNSDINAAGAFLSVRFGNVLGSAGSVLPTFRHQIACGGPVTVTHPDATRFFMTIPEAVELVMQAGAIGQGSEVMVLDMGDPVRILDMARRLISHSDKDVKVVFTGLRPGEKLHEVLFSAQETLRASAHPLIKCTDVPPIDPTSLRLNEITAHG